MAEQPVVFSRQHILFELAEVSDELRNNPLTGEYIQIMSEANRLLDLYIDLGYQSTKLLEPILKAPLQGYESE